MLEYVEWQSACEVCGAAFTVGGKNRYQRFCGATCRQAAHRAKITQAQIAVGMRDEHGRLTLAATK